MASKKWCSPAAKLLLHRLTIDAARRRCWRDTEPCDILKAVNAALSSTSSMAEPQTMLLGYTQYMILSGYTLVKLGRRRKEWRKI